MNILVTAGNTQTPIDRVRCITNIFSGRTGAAIASHAHDRGHRVVFLTSHPEVLDAIPAARPRQAPSWEVHRYRTFADLERLMALHIAGGGFGVVIHAAAVNDYHVAGILAPAPGTRFDPADLGWDADGRPRMVDTAAGKVKGHHPELWLRLVPAPKLVDKVRGEWGFRGTLVKFKLEVGVTDRELLGVAENSRQHSGADLMVANTLEGAAEWAYVGAGTYERVTRADLPGRLLERVEALGRS
jgi:phosphopantothenate-cysteine ligase/phosphopantothenoylcysteine decarboxylase/phosphopantothenate--cysteine ligase